MQGIAGNCNLGHARYDKAIGKSGEQRKEMFSYRGKLKLSGTLINTEPTGGNWQFEK